MLEGGLTRRIWRKASPMEKGFGVEPEKLGAVLRGPVSWEGI